jgi:hypothetical protein
VPTKIPSIFGSVLPGNKLKINVDPLFTHSLGVDQPKAIVIGGHANAVVTYGCANEFTIDCMERKNNINNLIMPL